jgi:hypothetical protein
MNARQALNEKGANVNNIFQGQVEKKIAWNRFKHPITAQA